MERKKLAENIISTCREMNASGLNQGTSGNVSARYAGGMLITPSGIAYSKMTPDMIVFVDDKGVPEAGKIPSSEWLFHLTCYKAARTECRHTHACGQFHGGGNTESFNSGNSLYGGGNGYGSYSLYSLSYLW